MPFTPFHFGPGLFIKALCLKRFSLTIFIATQVIIDCETAWNIIKGNEKWHTLLHTYLGSLLVVVLFIFIGKPIYRISMKALRLFYRKPLYRPQDVGFKVIILSAFIGAWSHVLLDSIMHFDVAPFLPFSHNNPALGTISLLSLHLGCIVAGGLGVLIWMDRNEKPMNPLNSLDSVASVPKNENKN